MKIKTINLYNFGSYEGHNAISFENNDLEKRVVVIGGKNGAGKTTLFTALQICLYGYHTFGFKGKVKQYYQEIYNLVNNKVRLDESASSHVEVVFEQTTNTEKVLVEIKRLWTWRNGAIEEHLIVSQNGKQLDEEGIANFQKHLVHLIPPELLKLYFFDGEKVADYFLGNQETNIRDALMVLSGHDTFDLLYENIQRILKVSGGKNADSAKLYLEAKQKLEEINQEIITETQNLDTFSTAKENLQTDMSELIKSYSEKGGISLEEWSLLQGQLKAEEDRREKINAQKKTLATDILPFLIIPNLVSKIPAQIRAEKSFEAYRSFQDILSSSAFASMLSFAAQELGSKTPAHDSEILLKHISSYFSNAEWNNYISLLGLSNDEEMQVNFILSKVQSSDVAVFKKLKEDINASLERSRNIRAKLQESNIEHFEEHIKERTKIESEQEILSVKIEHTNQHLQQLLDARAGFEDRMKSAKKAFEEQLKQQSLSAISGRMLLLLEDLQKELYTKLIRQVEYDINAKFRQLIQKRDFFSYIKVDDNFNFHILRNRDITKQELLSQFKGKSISGLVKAIGPYAVHKLQELLNVQSYDELKQRLTMSRCDSYWLPFEIDKNRLSSGEKQIFVMSLYWAMMQQSKNDLPYVIDTPFARIDTTHRANITDYFFKQLDGQLIVLSTDEEISGAHMASMSDQISHIYMLEYGEDKSTHIHQNVYFEV